MFIYLLLLGFAVGSFLNVVALRYDPDKFLFGRRVIGGRSHCPYCRKTLRWYELIPLLSFVIQAGRCRSCKAKLDFQYPAVELIAGFIAVWTPLSVKSHLALTPEASIPVVSALWMLVFWSFLLLALIDLRLHLIPDELNFFLIILGFVLLLVTPPSPLGNTSFMGAYSLMFGLDQSIWISHFAAAAFGMIFIGTLIAVTKGRGMGLGDLKLATVLGLLFGWPDIVLVLLLAFVIGSAVALLLMALGEQRLKGKIAFGPYLVLASFLVFAFGEKILAEYFSMF
ncbi:MAG: prepilin peptidase [Candidatus Liptonbacteria bacterium]